MPAEDEKGKVERQRLLTRATRRTVSGQRLHKTRRFPDCHFRRVRTSKASTPPAIANVHLKCNCTYPARYRA